MLIARAELTKDRVCNGLTGFRKLNEDHKGRVQNLVPPESLLCVKNPYLVNGSLGTSHQCSLCLKPSRNNYVCGVGHWNGKYSVINLLKTSTLLASFRSLSPFALCHMKESDTGPTTPPFLFPKGHSQ